MKAGDQNLLKTYADTQWTTPYLSFKPKRMRRIRNAIEKRLPKILFVCLILSIAGNFIKK